MEEKCHHDHQWQGHVDVVPGGPLEMGERQLHRPGVCSVEARTTGKPSSKAIFITAEIWS